MAEQYYYLVSSLREYPLDSAHKDFDATAIRGYIRENLAKADQRLLDLFHAWYDVENLCSVIERSNRWSELGNFTLEELGDEVKNPERLPAFMARIVEAYNNPEAETEMDLSPGLAHALQEAFYAQTAQSDNRFMREWYEFDRTLRNICAAVAARRASRPVEDVLIGGGVVVEALKRAAGNDFGLKGEVEYADQVVQLMTEVTDLLEKERRLDVLRWTMADQLTAFNYFDMDRVLACMVKVNLVHRWRTLDPKIGAEMFDHLLQTLSGEELFEWIAKKEENDI
jgi:hypothetical protein